jgi:hypothetical protein
MPWDIGVRIGINGFNGFGDGLLTANADDRSSRLSHREYDRRYALRRNLVGWRTADGNERHTQHEGENDAGARAMGAGASAVGTR